ncbi:MAG: DNA polymerase III subunit alpha, partial [Nitratireductor sp.]
PINKAIIANNLSLAKSRLQTLDQIFEDRLYVEIQRHGTQDDPQEEVYENPLLQLAYDLELPLVATNQIYFPQKDDYNAHDALICIAQGVVIDADDRRRLTPEYSFKSQSEMLALFDDLPEAIENTLIIAKRCSYRAPERDPILPRFANVQEGANEKEALLAEANILRENAQNGLKERIQTHGIADGFSEQDYNDRLDYELGIIEQMGFPGYFLIVADFIQWAKNQGIPVGPGRGSGAGSLVAFALTITDIDPLRFALLFERFLNPERVSMPDFDIDFCQERREEVIKYVQKKYGREQVAQIITFGSLQARAVLRDVGRVLQMPYGQVDRIAKLVPNNPASPVTLKEAIDGEQKLQDAAKEEAIIARLFDIATRLEGLYRHASTHAAGIVIGDRKLDELVPLYRDPRSDMPVTQFNMKWVEPAGLVKFDFLGLKTLTTLQAAVKFVSQRDIEVDLDTIPIDDKSTFSMLTRGETIGVFQLESAGMRKALIGMKPDRFEDIIALVALYRPGPMENIPVYNERKNGEAEADYYHPLIEDILKETHGVIIYQEQVMQVAQVMAGYSLGDADLLRRAMGKKIKAEMDKQRSIFVTGAEKNKISKSKANEIFDLLAKFANYGFNKSHAAAYALVSYQTAYMRAQYPVEFLAASMQLDLGNTDKLAIFRQDAKQHDIEIVPPSIKTSFAGFSVKEEKIYYALAAIKGVGEAAVANLVEERETNGQFTSLEDFFSRIDVRLVNKRTIENLICAGALDCFGHSREQLLAGMERLTGHAARLQQDRESGQNDMFGSAFGEDNAQETKIELPNVTPWQIAEKLQREFASMGFYLSAHPLDEYRDLMEKMRVQLFADFETSVRAGATAGRLAGTITSKQERKTRTGKSMGIVTISDPTGQYEAVIFEEGLNKFRDFLEPGNSVVLMVGADIREEGVSIRIQSVDTLEAQAAREQRNLRVYLKDEQPLSSLQEMFTGKMKPPRGDSRVSMILIHGNGAMEVEMMLKERFKMTPQVASAIKAVPGVLEVELI